jgi:hypothetical protein
MTSKRGNEWIEFSMAVLRHIENYTVPQYKDKGEDQLTTYTAEDCRKQVDKYQNRRGKNQREGQDELDILKAAHYLAVAWSKMKERNEDNN